MSGDQWLVPAMSVAAAVAWLMALRAALPAIRSQTAMSLEARAAVWAALVLVSAILAVSSTVYVGLIDAEASRVLLLATRPVLLVAGIVTWMEVR